MVDKTVCRVVGRDAERCRDLVDASREYLYVLALDHLVALPAVRRWSTKAGSCHSAATVLHLVFRCSAVLWCSYFCVTPRRSATSRRVRFIPHRRMNAKVRFCTCVKSAKITRSNDLRPLDCTFCKLYIACRRQCLDIEMMQRRHTEHSNTERKLVFGLCLLSHGRLIDGSRRSPLTLPYSMLEHPFSLLARPPEETVHWRVTSGGQIPRWNPEHGMSDAECGPCGVSGSAVKVVEEKKCVVRSEHLSGTLGSHDPRKRRVLASTNITCLRVWRLASYKRLNYLHSIDAGKTTTSTPTPPRWTQHSTYQTLRTG
jgi:hypothetical protein